MLDSKKLLLGLIPDDALSITSLSELLYLFQS